MPPDAAAGEWADAPVQLALRANDLGYALIETFALVGDRAGDDVVLAAVEALATRLQLSWLLLVGAMADDRIHAFDLSGAASAARDGVRGGLMLRLGRRLCSKYSSTTWLSVWL